MRVMHVQQAIEMIQAEYERTPGLRVTFWQAQRLWNLPSESCEHALTALIRARFLVPAPDGTYFRRAESSGRVGPIESAMRAMCAR